MLQLLHASRRFCGAPSPRTLTPRVGSAFRLASITLLLSLWSSGPALALQEPQPDSGVTDREAFLGETLSPSVAQEKVSRDIARQLQYSHYRTLRIDREVSSKVFDNYLSYLDGQKLYFLESDIKEFEVYRHRLDGALKTGQLDPAFRIYNRLQERLYDRITFALKLLENSSDKLDFEKDETILVDRADEAWPSSEEAMNEIWRKRVKNSILSLELTGKKDDEIRKTLTKRYESQLRRASQTRSEDVFQGYMNAFTGVYDPHTQYFSPRVSENFNINMSLSLEGIGAVLQTDDEYTKVVRLVPAGPADKAGQLKPADKVVAVGQDDDGELVDVVGWRLEEVVDLIRGPKQSIVRLKVIPANAASDDETRVLKIVRDRVALEDQSASKEVLDIERDGKDYKVGVIEIPTFYADFKGAQLGDPDYKHTTADVRKLLKELEQSDIDGLVIDLRNNGGGALQEAITLTGLFIPQGPTVQVRTSDDRIAVHNDPDKNVVYGGPLVVLVNRMSASASEIFAAAIQDYGRGLVVGNQTFGKGTVQSVRNLASGQLKITEFKFYRVSGGSTQHSGVLPDITFPSAIDVAEIGEDALPEALPWDQIAAADFEKVSSFDLYLPELARQHESRMLKNKEYQAILEEISFLAEAKAEKELSLVLASRKAQLEKQRKKELSVVNAKRTARGEDVFEDFKAYETFVEAEAMRTDKDDDEADLFTKESGEILIDLLNAQSRVATHSPT
ncbi:carboxy terminal-processing peptidase [Allohahella marinimesophila]|uniref:Carboxy terminal-processing peptidase n=1 Tax=Allohahella marinimesophila TaxID=1054972 RepID=A0ABP7NRL3_9GAMM